MDAEARPVVSVVVPVYNLEACLSASLASIEKQTLESIEIICVDDGSADSSGGLLDAFAMMHANVIVVHKRNSGVTASRIAGINISSGDYIGFCDGDDTIEPDMYQRLYDNLIKYHADISHCGHKVVYVDGREEYFYNTGRLAKQDKTEGLKGLLSGSFEPGLCSKLYSKTLLHSLLHSGAMDTGIKINEDLLMNFYLFRKAECSVYEDICPYHYLKRDGSASRSKMNERHIFDPIQVKKIIYEDCKGTREETIARKMLLSKYLDINNSLIMGDKSYRKEYLPQIRSEMRNLIPEAYLLGKKRKIAFLMAVFFPFLYSIFYRTMRRSN